MVNFWLQQRGFSIGIGDTIADENTMSLIEQAIESSKNDCKELIRKARQDQLERMPGRTMMETFEHLVNESLNSARNKAGGHAQKSLKSNNNMKAMCDAGSKGSALNSSQVTYLLGSKGCCG